MSLETVVEDVRAQAEARRDEIVADAEERAEDIVSEAETEAEEIREAAREDVEREIEREREQELSTAKLAAKQERLEARREILATVREEVEAELAAIDGDRRRELTRVLVEAAAAEFDEGPVRIYGRPDDAELLEDVLDEFEDLELAGERECLGGVVADSDASRVRVNNTFDSVLEEVWEDSLRDVSAHLFEE